MFFPKLVLVGQLCFFCSQGNKILAYKKKKASSIATCTSKLKNLIDFSIQDTAEQLKFSQETEQFQKMSEDLLRDISELASSQDADISHSDLQRKRENAMIELRHWALKVFFFSLEFSPMICKTNKFSVFCKRFLSVSELKKKVCESKSILNKRPKNW